MAKYKRKSIRRMRFVQNKNGQIIEDSTRFYERLFPDDVQKVFLANLVPAVERN